MIGMKIYLRLYDVKNDIEDFFVVMKEKGCWVHKIQD